MEQEVKKVVQGFFSPEFLNRLDEQILFQPLSRDTLRKIIRRHLSTIAARLKGRDITFSPTTSGLEYILKEVPT